MSYMSWNVYDLELWRFKWLKSSLLNCYGKYWMFGANVVHSVRNHKQRQRTASHIISNISLSWCLAAFRVVLFDALSLTYSSWEEKSSGSFCSGHLQIPGWNCNELWERVLVMDYTHLESHGTLPNWAFPWQFLDTDKQWTVVLKTFDNTQIWDLSVLRSLPDLCWVLLKPSQIRCNLFKDGDFIFTSFPGKCLGEHNT